MQIRKNELINTKKPAHKSVQNPRHPKKSPHDSSGWVCGELFTVTAVTPASWYQFD